ncbi:OsmC-like protein [Flagelloscypha sp. PMI_526]|nr:OsmC-like protein [Flagelloscypha sp. PMI_526]
MSFRLASRALSRRSITTLAKPVYTAHATATGKGRNGSVTLVEPIDGAPLSLKLEMPKALGGNAEGHNPEQLFALGYAGCMLGAVHKVAGEMKKSSKDATVDVAVTLGVPNGREGLGLAADIKFSGVDDDVIQAAHQLCPYSRALEDGVKITLSKA